MKKINKTIEDLQKEAQIIKKQFDSCINFKKDKGILTEAKRGLDFYEGRQWGDFKGKMPIEKPVVNFISTIIDAKVASINQKSYKIGFRVDDDQTSTNDVTKFCEFQTKEMEQDNLNYQSSIDGLVKGTYCEYFYWDNDALSVVSTNEGALKAVNVDAIEDIAVANPNERDVQKQEWIILRTRESVKAVRQMCNTLKTDEDKKEYIQKNSFDSTYTNNVEQEYDDNCYSYTKFFKQDGEVYFEKSTETILYQEPIPLNPLITENAIKIAKKKNEVQEKNDEVYENDPVNRQSMTEPKEQKVNEAEMNSSKFKARYYPFVIDSFLRRDNCIFGRSMAYSLIPMQKIVNQLVATNTLSAVKSVMPTIIAKQGALGTTDLDLSKPGGLLIDRSVGQSGFGITTLQTPQLTTTHFQLAQSMISLIKDVYKATDILDDGRNISSKMSGYAMSQLQTIQDKPVAQLQTILKRSIEREGRILEQFYKLNYRNVVYSYELTDTELLSQYGDREDVDVTQLPRTTTGQFKGRDYLNTPFNVIVEASETAQQSELMLVSTLETLFLNGTIEKLSPEDLMMWAELVPNYAFPKKDEFKRLIQKKLNSLLTQKDQIIAQLTGQLDKANMVNGALKQEFTNKINQYNDSTQKMSMIYKSLNDKYNNLLKQQQGTGEAKKAK